VNFAKSKIIQLKICCTFYWPIPAKRINYF